MNASKWLLLSMTDPIDSSDQTPFAGLIPDVVLTAVEAAGFITDGRLLALNSYENRVWQVGIEQAAPVVAKFYRPGRWTDGGIIEEHRFTLELANAEISVVPPLLIGGHTLLKHAGFRYALFSSQGGHAPELAHEPSLKQLGRVLGRMHAVGAAGAFAHRPVLSPEAWGREAADWLVANQWIPAHLEAAFTSLADSILSHVDAAWARAGDYRPIRLHGDCHPGNILWRNDQAHFVDLDDCLTGPAAQDLWMLIAGDRTERTEQLGWLLEGYQLFADFDTRELNLIEPLRALRMINHQAWLAKRWNDPAFPRAFPWFADDRHWETVIQQLQEQLGELQEPPLSLSHR